MVRDAIVTIENGPVLMAWVPGHDAIAAPSGAAFKLPAGAKLRLQIHYKKNWQDEQNAKTDRTTIGLYFTDEPISGRSIEAWPLTGLMRVPRRALAQGESQVHPRISRAAQALETRDGSPRGCSPCGQASNRRTPRWTCRRCCRRAGTSHLLLLHAPRPEWPRRYWLAEPIELPQGTTVEVTAVLAPPNPDEFPRRGAAISGRARLRRTISPTTKTSPQSLESSGSS